MDMLNVYDKDHTNDLIKLEHKGKKIYSTNNNMRNLALIMENDTFKTFFDVNFNTKEDINTVLMIMNSYRYIDKVCDSKYINIFHKLSILSFFLKNPKTRKLMIDSYVKLYHKPDLYKPQQGHAIE